MSTLVKEILKSALALSPVDKAELVDEILSTLDQPDERLDSLWRKEVENRIDTHERGGIKSVSIQEVLAKYGK